MDEWAKWRQILSPAAVKVWTYLSRWEDRDATMSELTRALGLSKTAIRQALDELASHGFIAVSQEWDDESQA